MSKPSPTRTRTSPATGASTRSASDKAQASSKKAPAPRARDAVALLKADHAEVKQMYKAYEKLVDDKADAGTRGALAIAICHALTAHATAESELFYPAARDALEDQQLLDHADVEHASVKDLITQIEGMNPDESHYDAKVVVLCEYVAHHVKEEEGELFPACRKARSMDLKALGVALEQRKRELLKSLIADHAHHLHDAARSNVDSSRSVRSVTTVR